MNVSRGLAPPRDGLGRRVRWTLALIALCALATCPAAQRRCAARQTAREAPALLRYLVDQIQAHVAEHHALPAVAAGPTPAIGACCERVQRCAPEPARWDQPGWRALGFSIDGPHHFSYQVAPNGAGLLLTAIGDQDCDGVRASYQVAVTLEAGRVVERWTVTDGLE